MIRSCLISMRSHFPMFFLSGPSLKSNLDVWKACKLQNSAFHEESLIQSGSMNIYTLCKSMIQALPWENELQRKSRRRQTEET